MATIGLIFFASTATLLSVLLLWILEYRCGTRLVVRQFRNALDRLLFLAEARLQRLVFWYRHMVVRLGWRSLVHSVLRGILLSLSYVYDQLLALFERNLAAAKALRQERKRWRSGQDK